MESYEQGEEESMQEDSLLDPNSSYTNNMQPMAEEEQDLDRHERQILTTSLPITRLDENVVNRIAAGEIIHRPANALKELIENSLDAGATLIKITLKEGGLKMLQIQDNGCGVRPADLPLLCERFATSKLKYFSDLSRMTTFGFRGEALASISYVSASMTVVTKARSEGHAYRASYSSGSLVPSKPGQSPDPKPCAGTDGTTITAEDIFYNAPLRRRALKSAAEEYNRALEVAGKYAIHYGGRGVGFVMKKASVGSTDLSTPSSPTATTQDAIRMLHGAAVARELIRLKPMRDNKLGFSCEGWISGANWSAKKTTFLCFINHRLVECSSLKRSLETVYSALLPKGGHPWVYLGLEIDPAKVDVNVHPTKKEVHFLDEDEIIEAVCNQAQNCLAGANSSRTFQFTQAVLPGASDPSSSSRPKERSGEASTSRNRTSSGPASSQKGYPQHMVRTDAKSRTLDSMFGRPDQSNSLSSKAAGKKRSAPEEDGFESLDVEMDGGTATQAFNQEGQVKIAETECMLSSIRDLRSEIKKRKHNTLTEVMQNHTFVGVVDQDLSLSLIQQETKLYLVNHAAMIEEFAYQLIIRQFGNLQPVRLDPAPLVKDLVSIGLQSEPDAASTGIPHDEIIERISNKLISQSVMLEEYFSFRIDPEKGTLETIPRLLPRFPNLLPLERLPTLLLRLGPQVDWTDEKLCFESFARELAFAHLPATSGQEPSDEDFEPSNLENEMDEEERESRLEEKKLREKEKWEIQHAWFSSMRSIFLAPKSLLESQIVLVSTLPELYKVFERC